MFFVNNRFGQKSQVWSKFDVFVKNRKFGQNIDVLVKNRKFDQKSMLLLKIEN